MKKSGILTFTTIKDSMNH